ncbi:HEAT repeat domain-containing protein [Desulfococcaceae bacterium HSG8]|nr:HEAT repeat domain-containing protein [Desulfococcaceae bacterium HSG8]
MRKIIRKFIKELKDHLECIESESSWIENQAVRCMGCREQKTATACKTPIGHICISCTESALKTLGEQEEIAAWHFSRFKDALSPEGEFRWRLAVLWRYKEAETLTSKQSPQDVDTLKRSLVQNLGYILPHPLAQCVRQTAYETCVAAGKDILPLLLEMCETEPWQFYSNIVLSAGKIAPGNKEVRALLEKAVQDPNPEVKGRVLTALSDYDTPWSRGILDKLRSDPDPLIRDIIPEVIARWESALAKASDQRLREKSDSPPMTGTEKIIDDVYDVDSLRKLYRCYLHHFSYKGKPSAGKMKKRELVRMFARVCSDEEHFRKFLSFLPEDVKKILNTLIWEGGERPVKKFEKKLNIKIITVKKIPFGNMTRDIVHDNYALFNVRRKFLYSGSNGSSYKYYLYLHDDLSKLFRKYLPLPSDAGLIPLDTIEKSDFTYEDKDQIISQIKLFHSYVHQGNLAFSKSTGKILVSSLRQMVSYCNIGEFYDDKDKLLQYMKTRLIIDFLVNAGKEPIDNPLEFLKKLFTDFFIGKASGGYKLNELLYHLKGIHNLRSGYHEQSHRKNERVVRTSLWALVKKLPVSQWISIENLLHYCFYRDVSLEIVSKGFAERYLSFNRGYEEDGGYSGYEQVNIVPALYRDALLTPFIKGVMFLFAGFGVLDIAYDLPENEHLREKDSKYLSIFDGLKYIRMTKRGAYVTGLTDGYDVEIREEEATAILDENRLMITMKGRDRLKTLALEKIGKRISDNCYKVDYSSFLKECYSKQDIRQKIKMFRERISSEPPRIWREFIDKILDRTDPVNIRKTMNVYKLKPDKELITLVAKDEILKRYILKAENYHILVDSKNLSRVKARLEEFGYFTDNIP